MNPDGEPRLAASSARVRTRSFPFGEQTLYRREPSEQQTVRRNHEQPNFCAGDLPGVPEH